MNFYQNLKTAKKSYTAAKCLSVFCALALGLSAIFYQPQDVASTTVSNDCALLADTTVAQPGFNCLFSSMTRDGTAVLPLCRRISATTYTIPDSNILGAGTRRYTCTNLSDLPLCSTFTDCAGSNNYNGCIPAKPGKNCAPLCDSSFNGSVGQTRGVDFAIHNRDCLRFCDALEAGVTTGTPDVNCVDRKCHQLATGTLPIPPPSANPNCALTPCNLLAPNELIDVFRKIAGDTDANRTVGKYCDGDLDITSKPMKCYNFNSTQIPYVSKNTMCIMHNCPPPCSNYMSPTDVNGDGVINSFDNDDTLNVSDRDKNGVIDPDTSYAMAYSAAFNGNPTTATTPNLSSSSYCVPVYCRPIVTKQFRCVQNAGDTTPTGDNTKDIVRNSSCDSAPTYKNGVLVHDGSVCTSNMCFKTIDCNDPVNNSGSNAQPECLIPEDGTIGSTTDTVNSAFYRPKPMNKATKISNNLRSIENMNTDSSEVGVCYSQSQMEARSDNSFDDHHWGLNMDIKIDLGILGSFTIPLGWFHSSLLPDEARSPGMCSVENVGFRGTGYIYLCYGDGSSSSGQLYGKVSDQTAYHSGYVQTTFTEGDATHKLRVCLRFRNGLRPDDGTSETCGERECAVSCIGFAGGCYQQNCGYDRCFNLSVTDKAPDECDMGNTLFTGNPSRGCTSTTDTYLRLRVRKYGNRICSFLDVKGQTAYDNGSSVSQLFMKGDEKLADEKTCVVGTASSSDNCSGLSSYQDEASAERWRTIKFGSSGIIPYIQDNQYDSNGNKLSSAYSGYFDKNSQFFQQQECINVPLRLPPPRLYNLATLNNSPKLFTPPIYITNALSKAGSGEISPRPFDESFGSTDFNYPAIQVNFGTTSTELNLGLSTTGYELGTASIPLTTTVSLIPYSVDVIVRKEFNETSQKPTFCLYRKIIALNGVEQDPERIGCVNRKLPEIDNTVNSRGITLTGTAAPADPKKSIIYLDPTSTFASSRIVVRYRSGTGNSCTDGLCSPELKLDNAISTTPTCNSAVVDPNNPLTISPEMNVLCAKREECSQLNVECMTNEINMQAARIAGQSTDSFMLARDYCNNRLLPLCNAKKGISSTISGTITDTNPSGATPSPTTYGWFNEICFVGGNTTTSYDSRLKYVVAYEPSPEGYKGKCITYEGNATCPNGGKAPTCNCQVYDSTAGGLSAGLVVRLQTQREAGLCVDMPLPQTCPAISYNPTPLLSSDPNYIYSSMKLISATGLPPAAHGANASIYNDVVHISHSLRNAATSNGHAEFPIAILGTVNVEGSCKGFWKNSISPTTGIAASPTRTCVNTNGNASWSPTVNNQCIRYSCDERTTTGAVTEEIGAIYQAGYASNESGDLKGTADGFATWPSVTKTNDFPEYASALACIPGFKKKTATKVSTGYLRTYEDQITGYTGGTVPTRICNQVGSWQAPTASTICERIKCPAIVPPAPSPADVSHATAGWNLTTADWAKWYDAGGASFVETDASRNTTTGILSTGTCRNDIGFFNLGDAPTRRCNYLGKWEPVVNPCTTRCSVIDNAHASGSNNGNASWAQTDIPQGQVEQAATFTSCLTGYSPAYVKYPYPAPKDKYGTPLTLVSNGLAAANITSYNSSLDTSLTSGTANFSSTIPVDVSQDTTAAAPSANPPRSASNPVKYCRAVSYDGLITNTWAAANSSCVNSCTGYSDDARIGVGVTQHSTSNGVVTLKWPSGVFGKWYYYSSGDANRIANVDAPDFSSTSQTAADYYSGRTNNKFVVARQCGSDGKWGSVVPQCVTNGGIIPTSYAIYNTSSRVGSLGVDLGATATATSCQTTGNYYQDGINGTPLAISSYSCAYKSGSTNIDEVYFQYLSGSACKVYCPAPAANTTYGNSKYVSGAPNYTAVGSKINLSCSTGYGNAFGDDYVRTCRGLWNTCLTSGGSDSCGRFVTDRISTGPTATCGTDGNFSVISDGSANDDHDCDACRSCNSSSSLDTGGYKTNYNHDECETCASHKYCRGLNGDFSNCSVPDLNPNQTYSCPEMHISNSYHETSVCKQDWDMYLNFSVKCVDGTKLITSSSCRDDCP